MNKRSLCFAATITTGLALFGLIPLCTAQDAAFGKANDHYKNGEYAQAISAYGSILSEGRESGALHFNLGNCYFRLQRPGRALLSYERARRLEPRAQDIQTNTQLARSRLAYSRPVRPKLLKRIVRLPLQWVSLQEATAGVLCLYLTFMAFLCVMVMRPSARSRLRTPTNILAVIFVLGSILIYANIRVLGREALVVRQRAEARFAPFEKATVHFELSEGMAVTVIEKKPGWLKVMRPDGKTGWLLGKTIMIL